MSEVDYQSVIIDNGSDTIKAGLSGNNAPQFIFPSVIGRPHPNGAKADPKEYYVGEEAQMRRDLLALKYPIKRGIISDWDAMEQIWHDIFYKELLVAPEDHPIVLTECPINPKLNKEKMTQIMFETFNTPALYITSAAALSLFSAGRTTGVVLDVGEDVTYAVPVYQGFRTIHATLQSDLGGAQLTEFLSARLAIHSDIPAPLDPRIVRDIKETMCYVAMDFDDEAQKAAAFPQLAQTYTLPTGQVITLNDERFLCPEALFQGAFMGIDNSSPVHELIYNAIMKCDCAIRKDLYWSIVLAGGSTLLPGFADRLHRELTWLAPATMKIKVLAPPDRAYSAWVGGSILASLSEFQRYWISREEYCETGPPIVKSMPF